MTKEERVKRDDFIVEMHNGGYSHKEIREALQDNGLQSPSQNAFKVVISRLIGEGRIHKRQMAGKDGHPYETILKSLQLRARGEILPQIMMQTGIPSSTQRELYSINKVRCGDKQKIDPATIKNTNGTIVKPKEAK